MNSTLCPKCGSPIRKRRSVSPSGRVTNTAVSLLGNPHDCPRKSSVATLLDQGKHPFRELEKRRVANGKRRVAKNTAKGLTIDE